jgi:hypothetical protein
MPHEAFHAFFDREVAYKGVDSLPLPLLVGEGIEQRDKILPLFREVPCAASEIPMAVMQQDIMIGQDPVEDGLLLDKHSGSHLDIGILDIEKMEGNVGQRGASIPLTFGELLLGQAIDETVQLIEVIVQSAGNEYLDIHSRTGSLRHPFVNEGVPRRQPVRCADFASGGNIGIWVLINNLSEKTGQNREPPSRDPDIRL